MEEFELRQREFQEEVKTIANRLQAYALELQETAKENVVDYSNWEYVFLMPDSLRHIAIELEYFLKENKFDNYPFR